MKPTGPACAEAMSGVATANAERERKAMLAGANLGEGVDRGETFGFRILEVLEVAIVRFDSPLDP